MHYNFEISPSQAVSNEVNCAVREFVEGQKYKTQARDTGIFIHSDQGWSNISQQSIYCDNANGIYAENEIAPNRYLHVVP